MKYDFMSDHEIEKIERAQLERKRMQEYESAVTKKTVITQEADSTVKENLERKD